MSWYRVKKDGVELFIEVKLHSKTTQLLGVFNNRLKIAVNAPPVDGKANQKIIDFLANFFALAKNSIKIIRGKTARKKVVMLPLSDIKRIIDFVERI